MNKLFSAGVCRLLFLLLLASAGLFATACKDTASTPAAPDFSGIDEAIIKKYVADSSFTAAQRQSSGLYYVPVLANAAGVRATAGKTVYVRYVGRLLSGRVFDSSGTAPFAFVLGRGRVIAGWEEGIALMRKGEKARLLIPSGMAYGASGAGSIPPNAVLRFDVELVEVL